MTGVPEFTVIEPVSGREIVTLVVKRAVKIAGFMRTGSGLAGSFDLAEFGS